MTYTETRKFAKRGKEEWRENDQEEEEDNRVAELTTGGENICRHEKSRRNLGHFFRKHFFRQTLLPQTLLPKQIQHFLFITSALFKVYYVVKPLWETIYFYIEFF